MSDKVWFVERRHVAVVGYHAKLKFAGVIEQNHSILLTFRVCFVSYAARFNTNLIIFSLSGFLQPESLSTLSNES